MSNRVKNPLEYLVQFEPRWILHVLFWVFIYADELLSFTGLTPAYESEYVIPTFIGYLADIVMVYLNLYVAMKYLYRKEKYWWYILFSVVSIVVVVVFQMYMTSEFDCEDCFEDNLSIAIGSFVATATLLAAAISLKLFRDYFNEQIRVKELESEKHQIEMKYLKDQMNPHFLFNALNGIYVKSRKKDESLPDNILQLSDLLRYQMYECDQEKVSLQKELEFLKNYIDLDKMRKSDLNVQFNIEGQVSNKSIAPFLLLPLVENALKYSTSNNSASHVDINLKATDDKLSFHVENSIDHNQIDDKLKGGIGLKNVRKRLELLYPNNHSLITKEEKNIFTCNLNIALS